MLNITSKIKDTAKYRNEINIKMEFRGPLYNGSKESLVTLPLNISLREKVSKASNELLISSYKEIPSFEVFVLSQEEIAAEKVRALLTRERARDLYDLWFLIKKGVKLDFNLINKKLQLYNKKYNKKDLISAVNQKGPMWNTDLKNLLIGNLPKFGNIKKGIFDKLSWKMQKRGQLAIFLVLGLVLFVIVGFLVFLNFSIKSKTTNKASLIKNWLERRNHRK